MNEMIKRRKDEGFTLIELMIVIAVIGILAVVLVPKMGSVKTEAKVVGVTSNVRSVATALAAVSPTTVLATKMTTAFPASTPNALVNPITGSTAYTIITIAPANPPVTTYAGQVIIQDDRATSKTIIIYGYDDLGNPIADITQTITP